MEEIRLRIDGNELIVLEARISERLSSAGRAELRVPMPEEPSDASGWLTKPATLALIEGGQEQRLFCGHVTGVDLAISQRESHVSLVVESRLSRLRLKTNSRIFRDLELADIAKQVIQGAGYSASEIEVKIASPPKKRSHVTQYRETDLAFLERFLGEAGLHVIVGAKDDKDTITLTDGDLGPLDPATIKFRDAVGLRSTDGVWVSGLKAKRKFRPGKVTLRDMDHTRPKLDLTKSTSSGSDAEQGLEIYHYPARSVDDGEIAARAKVMLGRMRADAITQEGETTSSKVAPGVRFTVQDHPLEALNRELLVTGVEVHFARAGSGAQASRGANRISFQAAAVGPDPLRPSPNTAARIVPGIQTGFVTGAAGKEIHPDDYGRVTVHPHWDREGPTDEKSSLAARAVQPALGGSMLTPRVGWEVVVGFLEGDIDAPMVLGRMIHGTHPPAYSLPGDKTKLSIKTLTTPGGGSGNEIRFNDAKGSEEMFVNASKDATTNVGNNHTEGVKVDETRQVGGNSKFAVTGSLTHKTAASQTMTVSGSQTFGVSTYAVDDVGTLVAAVGGSRTMNVGGDHKRTVGAAGTLTVGSTCIDLVAGTVDVKCLSTRDDTFSAVNVVGAVGSRLVNVTGARTEDAGAVKAILAAGNRVVETDSMSQTVIGAIGALVKGDRSDTASGSFKEVAAGAHLIKAANITIEGKELISIVMGASTVTLTPASVSIAGTSIKFTGNVEEIGLVADNI